MMGRNTRGLYNAKKKKRNAGGDSEATIGYVDAMQLVKPDRGMCGG